MGQIKDDVSKKIVEAMKAKDKVRLNVLRYLKKLFIENDTSKKPIDENDIVISYAKKMKDSISSFPEGSTQQKELIEETKILDEFLPKQLSEEEVQTIINSIIKNLESPNLGLVMKELTPQIKGKFDGKRASELVKMAVSN
jgi:uncharacterized protein YqeY